MPADRQAWLQLTGDADVCKTTDELSKLYKAGDTKRYDNMKRKDNTLTPYTKKENVSEDF